MRIGMTSIYVNDVTHAFEFYTEVLGFQEQLRMPEANLAVVASPEQPDGTALLLEPNENPIARTYQEAIRKEGLPVIVFSVDNVQAEYDRLKEEGVVFTQEPTTSEWGTQAVFDDSCGNFIQIHEA